MLRLILFLGTNLAIMLVLSITLRLLGFEAILDQQGVNLDLNSLVLFAGVFGMGGSLISLLLSRWTAMRMTGARLIERPSGPVEQWLLATVRSQAQAAGIGVPDLAVFDAEAPNAFATGWNRDKALVAVSTGLVNQMRREEVEAVIGHEISHVANGDMVTLALIQGVVNTFVIVLSRVVGHFVDRVLLRNERGHGPGFWLTTLAAEMVLGILASLIVFWFSRRREFRADAGGARLAGTPAMISALRRLMTWQDQPSLPDQMATFAVRGGTGLTRLFSTHPPLAERIRALEARSR